MTPIPDPAARSWNWLNRTFFQSSVSSAAGYDRPSSQAKDAHFSASRTCTSESRMFFLWFACVVITPRWYSKYISLFHVGIDTLPGTAGGAVYPFAIER